MKRVVWYLSGGQTIEKVGEGIQQVFADLSREERAKITFNTLSVSETDIPIQDAFKGLTEEQIERRDRIYEEFALGMDS
jgi:hypothetical protein